MKDLANDVAASASSGCSIRSGASISFSLQSRIGLNAANFFPAEVTGVILPFLNDFLRSRQLRYDSIGLPTAIAGLGVFLMPETRPEDGT
jgi:hypothetical protein